MLQLEDHSFTRRQLVQRVRDASAQLAPHQVSFRIRSAAPVPHLCQHIVLLAVSTRCNRRIFLSHLLLADLVQAQIGHDPVNPGVKRALEAEPADVLVSLQEGFLINVLGFVLRSGQVQRQPKHRLVVVAHQFLERGAAAALSLPPQLSLLNPPWYFPYHPPPLFPIPLSTPSFPPPAASA